MDILNQISKAIKEAKWLEITYQNKQNETTQYWIAIKDMKFKECMTMKKLNAEEIKQFADALIFTESEAKDITDLFYNLKMENPVNHWKIMMPLNDVDEYNKLQNALNEAKSCVRVFDNLTNDEKVINMFGDGCDNLYKLVFNKASSFVNKVKKYEESAKKKSTHQKKIA